MRVFSTLMFLWSNKNRGKQRSKKCNQNLTQLIVDESYCRMESLKTAQPRSVHPLSWLSGTNFPRWELIIQSIFRAHYKLSSLDYMRDDESLWLNPGKSCNYHPQGFNVNPLYMCLYPCIIKSLQNRPSL